MISNTTTADNNPTMNEGRRLQLVRANAAVIAFLATAACVSTAVAGGGGAPKQDDKPKYAKTIEQMFEMLPRWSQVPRPPKVKEGANPLDAGAKKTVTDENGQKFERVTRRYSLADTPKEFVAMTTSPAFWVGGLVQCKDLEQGIGGMRELSVTPDQRAPFALSIPDYGKKFTINQPSSSNVAKATSNMMAQVAQEIKSGKRKLQVTSSFNSVQTNDERQTALALGLSAKFASASMSASLDTKKSIGSNTYTGCYIERAFTVEADFEGRTRGAAFFRPTYTVNDAAKLQNMGQLTLTNPPAFISSATYGRIIMLRVTSKRSANEIKVALDAAFKVGNAGGSVETEFSKLAKESSTEIKAAVYGGDESTMKSLIEGGNVLAAIKNPPSITTMKPISYRTYACRDKDELATSQMATEYDQVTYEPIGGGTFAVKIYAKVLSRRDYGGVGAQDLYGTLMLNGKMMWKQEMGKRGKGTKSVAGGDIVPMVGEDAPPAPNSGGLDGTNAYTVSWVEGVSKPIRLEGLMMEWDNGKKRDDTMGIWETSLNIGELSKRPMPIKLTNKVSDKLKNQERAELYLYIERK